MLDCNVKTRLGLLSRAESETLDAAVLFDSSCRSACAGIAEVLKKSAVRVTAINFTISSIWSLLFVKVRSKV